MLVKICRIGDSAPVVLAARELKKYLGMMDGSAEYALMSFPAYDPEIKGALWVGMDKSFPLPAVPEPELDDGIAISVSDCAGYVTGVNERAVLIAAYRFLRELGCAFIRPGDDGEIVPKADVRRAVSVSEVPSCRHRAICIEGAVSGDDVTELLKWMPKVGLNGYYTQFKVPKTFYDRWYSDHGNSISTADAFGLMNDSVAVLKERGMLYHAIGHGWTCEPFGVEGGGWYKHEGEIPESIRDYLAVVNGKREFWGGVPLNTNLCYSNPTVQDKMSSAVAEYAVSHPETDYIHVWLADGTNNHCECENCRKKRPADFYVQLLNRIGEKLTAAGSKAKVVFLIYVDLLWEPLTERLDDPDRFVLMFAPITRSYSAAISQSLTFDGELPDYVRNKNKMPKSVAENVARLRKWQENFKCDSFDFDYHYMWDVYKDIGGMSTASVMFEDMKSMHKIGLNGMVSCQCVRAFFPHGLGMNGMAAALWDENADYDAFANGYFSAAYGEDGALVRDYLTELTRLADPRYFRGETDAVMPSMLPDLEKAKKLVADFRSVIARNIDSADKTVALSFFYLSRHSELAELYLDMEAKLASGDADGAKAQLERVLEYSLSHENELHRVFDHHVFRRVIRDKIVKKLTERMANNA